MNNTRVVDSPVRTYNTARSFLLTVILLTGINCVISLIDGFDRYFLCSIYSAYICFLIKPLGIIVSVLILAAFICAYIFSKKSRVWMIVGLSLFSVDTLFTIGLLILGAANGEGVFAFSMLLEIVIHVVGVVILALGVAKAKAALNSGVNAINPFEAGNPAQQANAFNPANTNGFEVPCTAFIKLAGNPNQRGIGTTGVIRFENDTVVVATADQGAQMLVGNLASMKERVRFPINHIRSVVYRDKNRQNVLITLYENSTIFVTLTKEGSNNLSYLFAQRGIQIYDAQA